MDPTLAWLLAPDDPAVRAQALVHLSGLPEDDPSVREARRASLSRGTLAPILAGLSIPEDPAALWRPKYGATYHRLVALVDLGVPPDAPRVQEALEACLSAFARPDGGFDGRPGRGGGHLCITGNLVRAAILLGRGSDPRVQAGVAWLLELQRPDGGWHCFPEDEPGGTLDAWEPLAALGAIPPSGRSPEIRGAIGRGVEFLLRQRLGVGIGYAPWERLHLPRHYYYDFLLGLEIATALGDPRDARLGPGLDLLRAKRRPDGAWALDATHPDVDPEGDPPYKPVYAEMMRTSVRLEAEPSGAPSRWATLAALRVLARAASPRGLDANDDPR